MRVAELIVAWIIAVSIIAAPVVLVWSITLRHALRTAKLMKGERE